MADHSKPTTTSLYTAFVTELDGRFDDLAVGLDPAVTTATNIPTNAIRWSSANNKWQKWNGTVWNDLTATYALSGLSTSGNATIGGTLTSTGNATFNGTAPIISAKIGPTSTQQHTVPAVTSDTVVLVAATQTLTGKTLTSPTINTPAVSGGTINSTPIGGTTPAAGAFTSLSASTTLGVTGAATLSSTLAVTGAATLTGGAVTSTIGPATGQLHTLPAVTSDTVALLGATQALTNKTINASAIGGTTPAAAAFTTISATGQLTLSGTGAAVMNVGTTAQRPTPATGMFRFNSTLSKFEGYTGTAWGSVGGGATGGGTDEVFVENSQVVTANYTLTSGKNAHSVGPITINSGIAVTVPSGARWLIS